MLQKIKEFAQNIPEEVINLWLLPFAEEGGWPPSGKNRWDVKKTGESISFWNDADWEKASIDLSVLKYSQQHFEVMRGLEDAYVSGIQNIYLRTLGNEGKNRYISALLYILKNGKFPQPPIVTIDELGDYQILDGNHRFFGLKSAKGVYRVYATLNREEQNAFLTKLSVSSLSQPSDMQEIWICRPKWGNSPNAGVRARLRQHGFNIFNF